MLDRHRIVPLGLAAVTAACFAILAWAVTGDATPLGFFDEVGADAEAWADNYPLLVHALRLIEVSFSTVGMTIITAITAIALWIKKHRRAAIYAVAVMAITSGLTTLFKNYYGRQRPDWQDPFDLHDTMSFPSGHASSSAAYVCVLAVIALMLCRRAGARRAAYAGATLFAAVVGADRVLLGRHYPSDVVGGVLLAITVALVVLALFNPLPRSIAAKDAPADDAQPVGRRLAVVVNPVKVESLEEFRTIVARMADQSGWGSPRWHYTTVEDPGTGMARDAAAEGADLVIVCGGDGTVREVCAELAGTGIPVGIVPAGTGNLLARNLDIPLFLRAAIDVGLNGRDRVIDLASVSGDDLDDTHFMVMAGMGLDAAIMEGVNEEIKKRIGWFAYVISALKSLMSPPIKLEISIDGGEPTHHRARTVVVGNVGFLQAGMPLMPEASIDDGLLDVVLLHPQRFVSWIPLVVRVLSRHQGTDDTINRMTGRTVVIRAASPTPRQLDGDAIGPGHELRMECIPGRLTVRVPR